MDQITLTSSTPEIVKSLLENDPRLVSKHTTRQYESDLLKFEQWRAGRPLTKTLVESYAAHLQGENKAPATINQKLAAIRWYARRIADHALDYAGDKELAEHAARVATVEDVKGERPEKGRHIAPGELSALLQACKDDKSPAGIRDAALISLAWTTGLRREEISRIKLQDLTRTDEGIDITISGKGQKVRTVFIDDGALSYLLDWLDTRGTDPGRVFCSINKSGKIAPAGTLSGEALRLVLEKRSAQAKLSTPITWHDFRRTFAGNLWEAGVDGSTIQDLMGHATQDLTKRYDRRPKSRLRQAVKVLHVPYSPRTGKE
jgi:site-specific recombinase XerD